MRFFVVHFRHGRRVVTADYPGAHEAAFDTPDEAFAYLQGRDDRERRAGVVATTLITIAAVALLGVLIAANVPERGPAAEPSFVFVEGDRG